MKKRKERPHELPATVTYLAMEAKPKASQPPAPLLKAALLKCENPPVHFYRYLYDVIGRRYFWVERRLWNDDKLNAHLSEHLLALYVLYLGGVPAGMAELDFREPGVAQIAYFGLTPEFTGRRIGPWFLHQVIEICWAGTTKRVLVNTCTLDHKKALVTYQRAGFVAYARSQRIVLVPPDFPEKPGMGS
ncbi:MAG TPA: GNAT family N-acetyltransferase [Micropepsaceae bacterium]|nr:GNAT family N-acetyltransferase [Micropepsaceae bacterium]